jgi:hypothetical protein
MPTNRSEREDVAIEGATRNPADQPAGDYETKRLAELEKEIPLLDEAMADVRHRIERVVENHPQQRTTFSNGHPAVRVGAMELRHPDLRALETALDNLVQQWNSTLAEFAGLKVKMSRGESAADVAF